MKRFYIWLQQRVLLVYNVFGEVQGSEIANAMDIARGGVFTDIPSSYPEGAWYSYDDRTCDYACQVTEYFYWALTSLLGAQDFPGRYEEISHEWKANTPELVQTMDTAVYHIDQSSICITNDIAGW